MQERSEGHRLDRLFDVAVADVFFDSPAVRCINLTGSDKTARILGERAGRALKRMVLELGGFNPVIILDDA
ncbi:aldehyde dehydrogenase family protein, partial [Rhizobium johnstonii]|uniref:aldehyde dehydrogenase family protein n=1 Tax=Rhizobium johnstonii TaxID=3019933 RepID=UPI003F9C5145